jgi:hypothetical protein
MTVGRASADKGEDYFAKIMAMCSSVMQAIVNCLKLFIAEVTALQQRRAVN